MRVERIHVAGCRWLRVGRAISGALVDRGVVCAWSRRLLNARLCDEEGRRCVGDACCAVLCQETRHDETMLLGDGGANSIANGGVCDYRVHVLTRP